MLQQYVCIIFHFLFTFPRGNVPLESYWSLPGVHRLHCGVNVRTTTTPDTINWSIGVR